jgi:hypothetical protein
MNFQSKVALITGGACPGRLVHPYEERRQSAIG